MCNENNYWNYHSVYILYRKAERIVTNHTLSEFSWINKMNDL